MGFGFALDALFPSLAAEYNNPALFRPWSDPLMSLYFVEPFVLGVIMAWFWNMAKGLIKETDAIKKGVYFGLGYWVITIPGMIMSYSSFPISLLMTVSWSLSIFVQVICAGILFAKLNS
ncbi:MAG: hypothetical protein NTU57_01580 [Candidatus Aenigmarchaeota archaeon]|nr:hypothetical protein [Candidatus Aenigmarchaeota archaeon]